MRTAQLEIIGYITILIMITTNYKLLCTNGSTIDAALFTTTTTNY